MIKRLLHIFILVLLGILLISCSNTDTSQNDTSNPSATGSQISPTAVQGTKTPDTDKLTIDDIKRNYEGDKNTKILNITEYRGYILVEYMDEHEYEHFDWYNLKTGDRDVLPLYDVKSAKLIRIIGPNTLIFETDGISTVNGHRGFPQLIWCYRSKEFTGHDGDFYAEERDNYLEISREVIMGRKSKPANISDVRVLLNGVEILFEAKEGMEDEFYVAYTTLPPIKTSYIEDKNQFVIEFENTGISPGFQAETLKKDRQNNYVSSIELKKDNQNCMLIINLKETAKYYRVKEGDLEPTRDEFPYAAFEFVSEFEIW